MYKTLLVPLDGSKLSECALDHVKAIASGCQVPGVVLMTVLEDEPTSLDMVWSESMAREKAAERAERVKKMRQKAEDYLAGVAAGLKKEGITAQTIVTMSDTVHGAVDGILNYARDNKTDMIVMSTHGHSGISRWAFGSVAEKVVREATVPVLSVTPRGCRAP